MNDHADLALLGRQMQLAAWIMLFVYAATVMIVLPRELRFLREAEPVYRRRFIFLDVALQVSILTVLLPCAAVSRLTPELMIVVMAGFTALWLIVGVLSYLRYVYTYRILVAANLELLRREQTALAPSYPHDSSANHTGSEDKHG